MRKKAFYESISKIINLNVDIVLFNQKVNGFTTEKILESSKSEKIDLSVKLTTLANEILQFLTKIHSLLLEIDNLSKRNDYDFTWIAAGKDELRDIMTYVNLLEFNINQSLSLVDELSIADGDRYLDTMNDICNVILGIRKTFQPVQKRMAVINHHYELKMGIIESVQKEISCCLEKLSELQFKNNRLKINEIISNMDLHDIKKAKDDFNSQSIPTSDFVLFSVQDVSIFEDYTAIHEALSPIAESLNIIPMTLDEFCNSAKEFYKDLVVQNLTAYEKTIESFNRLRAELKSFKNSYIVDRVYLLCDRIIQLSSEFDTIDQLETILIIIKPLANYHDLDAEHLKQIVNLEEKLKTKKLPENIPQTPATKSKFNNPKSVRKFSNPLSETLKMKPILSDNKVSSKKSMKMFQTPKMIEEHVFSQSNMQFIERVKTEIEEEFINDLVAPNTPSADSSFCSSNSSPDTMKAKNIFDSPNPFITPNSRNFNKSNKSIITPLTTPRMPLTQKYVMLPVDEEPKHLTRIKYNNSNEHKIPQIPLLRFELSTVIKTNVENNDDEDDDSSETHQPHNVHGLGRKSIPPSMIPISNPKRRVLNLAQVGTSRIPLPTRPESKLSMIRSSSRNQSRQSSLSNSPSTSRPESRLENIASSMSAKLGTNSPISKMSPDLKPRPSTVMTQRELKQKERPMQPSRLLNRYPTELRNMKVRGSTSLGTRKNLDCSHRITSI